VKLGDLVRPVKSKDRIGIVVEIFDDLGEEDPWIRVLFTHPRETYQWVKKNGLAIVNEEKNKKENPPDSP
jgi:hypothetical protein